MRDKFVRDINEAQAAPFFTLISDWITDSDTRTNVTCSSICKEQYHA